MELAIVVGHTDLSKGAKMTFPYSFIQEYEFGTVLAGMIIHFAQLKKVSCRVFLRDLIGIEKCYKKVAAFGPDAAIELHFNSFKNPNVYGTETLYGDNPLSQHLAMLVHSQVLLAMKRDHKGDRGVKHICEGQRGYLNLHSAPTVPTILVEPFFGSNLDEARLGLEQMPELAKAIVEGSILALAYNSKKKI